MSISNIYWYLQKISITSICKQKKKMQFISKQKRNISSLSKESQVLLRFTSFVLILFFFHRSQGSAPHNRNGPASEQSNKAQHCDGFTSSLSPPAAAAAAESPTCSPTHTNKSLKTPAEESRRVFSLSPDKYSSMESLWRLDEMVRWYHFRGPQAFPNLLLNIQSHVQQSR